ncbi:MAG: glycosyltransferase [Planctomycetes bacterium]|nr:glycosyltransferase [Planctomycetota bacterium]
MGSARRHSYAARGDGDGNEDPMRILMTMFGWADSGGGTIFPRRIARELVARGHRVRVVYAAAVPAPGQPAYAVQRRDEDGVELVGIHNRPTPFLDAAAPARELHDPAIARLLRNELAAFAPEVVHYHNFLGLSAAVTAVVAEAGVPSCYTPYNFWAVCPTLYLTLPDLTVCGGTADDGENCRRCARTDTPGADFVARRDRLRDVLVATVDRCLPTSAGVRDVLLAQGYPAPWLQVQRSGSPRAEAIWQQLGATRQPGVSTPLRFGYAGSLLPIKGVHVLVAAAQRLRGAFTVALHGSGPADYVRALQQIDRRGLVRFAGAYDEREQMARFAALDVGVVPSICLDQSPQVVDELQAARVPVLGARIGGIPDYVQQHAGELVAAGDEVALAAAMQRLVDAPQRVVDWQQRLRQPATFAAHVDALLAIYAELQGARQLPRPAPVVAAGAPARPRQLNLGCGKKHLPGWWNVDRFAAAGPDEVVDLERLPWPFACDSADAVLLEHVLEHLGRDSETFLGILRELYRVCAPGGTVRIVVPHPRHQDYLQDPTHVRPIVPELFLHTSLDHNRDWQRRGLPGTPLAEYLGLDFAIVSVEQRLDPHWRAWLQQDPARQQQIDAIARSQNNVVQEVEIVLRAVKPFRGAAG